MAMVSIAVSFLVMVVALAVSKGFREELRDGISRLTGDIQLLPVDMDYISEDSPISTEPSFLADIEALDEVGGVTPVVYRAGIVKAGPNIHGVLLKGAPRGEGDTTRLGVRIPTRLSDLLGLEAGDRMLTYFVGEESVKVRNFNITEVYEGVMDGTDNLIVLAGIEDLQRLNGWESGEASMLEISLKPPFRSSPQMKRLASEVGQLALLMAGDDDDSLMATSVMERYPQLFDWLNLIDFNVLVILVLMTIVAGFNMISGLLIMLFRNISTIGTLKSLGMTDRSISKVFLRVASGIALKGMLLGNGAALLLCLVQSATHILRLNPENYFVSFVPVQLDFPAILAADICSYLAILLLMLVPTLFISRIDPAKTVRTQ